VADLVRGLDGLEPRLLEPALARTLQDPGLRLLFPVGDGRGFVDGDGHPVPVDRPGSQRLTLLGAPDDPLAALLHDPVLAESPLLLESAAAAARLSLTNARLQAQIRAQLNETRASRARIVAAADAERQRIERNLHDGAQQRLVSLSLALRLAQARLRDDPDGAEQILSGAGEELTQALAELRELARGIHPAVLTDRGLPAALEALAARAPLPVELSTSLEEPLPQPVEAAAYYVVSEALANVAKYAEASAVQVRAERQNGRVLVEVADDGIGGADPAAGSGLRGLADRVEALDGHLEVESVAGSGTRVRAVIPLYAS
jgi:signal transduction histidine kinase